MTFWSFCDAQIGRMGTRGWLVVGLYALTWRCLSLIHGVKAFEKLEELVVQGIVIQGFLGLALVFYFAASKGGAEMADRNQTLIEEQAKSSPPIADDTKQR